MRIWFDLSNSPHINFFYALIKELEEDHEVIITCRPLANTIDLLDLYKLPYQIIGKHYGAKLVHKLIGYPIRVIQLYNFLRKRKPDVAISHSSFHSPIVSKLLGCRSIYLNDNEHAMGNIPAFLAATQIMIPEFLDIKSVKKQGASSKKIIQYPGVKEGIYLWNIDLLKFSSKAQEQCKKSVFIRPEPWTAQYYTGGLNFMDELIKGLLEKTQVVLLPRGNEQAKHYRSAKFAGLCILEKSISLPEIASACKLFIGAGGTMTREMAVLGIPTISVYQDNLLDVDKYLITREQMIHETEINADFALKFIEDKQRRPPSDDLLKKGKEAYDLIKKVVTMKFVEEE